MKKETVKRYLGRLLSFLRVRTAAGGLEVSDQVLRLAYPAGNDTRTAAVVLGPGVMERGAIKDPAAFAAALGALRGQVPQLHSRSKKMNVVVSLSSASIYTQSFTLPAMAGEELKKAIDLNIQMSSPDDLAKSYFGSRILSRDEQNERIEVAAAFIERTLIDDIAGALFAAGFVTIGVESKAISLVRMVRERGASLDIRSSYLVLDVDGTGVDFLVMRKGELYFEYATPWTDVADEKGEVTVAKFDETISMSLRQVSNFYRQHWQDALAGILVSSMAFGDEAKRVALEAAGGLPVIPLALEMPAAEGEAVSPEWLVALGASLRGGDIHEDAAAQIDLAGDVAAARYRNERMLDFLELWQVIVPVTLGLSVAVLALAYNFLLSTKTQLAEGASSGAQGAQAAQIASLEASSTAFNQEVQLALAAQAHADRYHGLFGEIASLAASSSVTVSRLTFQGASAPIALSGVASTENDIVEFKSLIEADPNFGSVNLPLSGIQPAAQAYSFTMTFPLAANAFQ